MVSHAHLICSKGMSIAIISATVETDNPEEEIAPAVSLLGEVLEMFVSVSNVYKAKDDGSKNNLWITSSYDATSHFESAGNEILEIFEKITGEKLDLNIEPDGDEEDN